MRTAIFVYQTTSIIIATHESDLQLSAMNGDTVALAVGDNAQTLVPGIYKIVSSHDVGVTGDTSAFDVVITTFNKDNDPTLPPLRATQTFTSLDTSALQAFMAVPEAKAALNP
jgi:hypothetical protein